jgi:hypothetical protein
MRRAAPLLAAVALLVALVIAGPGAPAARAAGPAPVEGPWGGRTTAGFPVFFEVREGKVVNLKARGWWGFECEGFSVESVAEPLTPDAGGAFAKLEDFGAKLEGAFVSPELAKGTLLAPTRSLPSCQGLIRNWTARPGPVPPAPPIRIGDGHGHLAAEPTRIYLSDNRYLGSLHWEVVNKVNARASGRAHFRVGPFVKTPRVKVFAEKPLLENGALVFHHISFRTL